MTYRCEDRNPFAFIVPPYCRIKLETHEALDVGLKHVQILKIPSGGFKRLWGGGGGGGRTSFSKETYSHLTFSEGGRNVPPIQGSQV